MRLGIDHMKTPVGNLILVWSDRGLHVLDFGDDRERLERLIAKQYPGWEQVEAQAPAEIRGPVERYFAGEIEAVETIPVEAKGSAFQMRVWKELREIPAGKTISYGELARRVGNPNASRAVGLANGQNPVAIVVPCHRVIGANGTLTGYGGGLDRKKWLLQHERSCMIGGA